MGKLVDATRVAIAAERRGEEGGDAGLGHLYANDARAHRNDVGVIVFAREAGGEWFGHQRTAAGGVAIDRNRNADAGTAKGDAAIGRSVGNRPSELVAIIGIIDARHTI